MIFLRKLIINMFFLIANLIMEKCYPEFMTQLVVGSICYIFAYFILKDTINMDEYSSYFIFLAIIDTAYLIYQKKINSVPVPLVGPTQRSSAEGFPLAGPTQRSSAEGFPLTGPTQRSSAEGFPLTGPTQEFSDHATYPSTVRETTATQTGSYESTEASDSSIKLASESSNNLFSIESEKPGKS